MPEEDLILVHTMGRVGSTTVHWSIQQKLKRDVFHIHALNPTTLASQVAKRGSLSSLPQSVRCGLAATMQVMRTQAHIKIVTLVRDPVERNLSAMFAALSTAHSGPSLDKLLDNREEILSRWEKAHHARPENWFRSEVEEPLGVDVYSQPFPDEGVLHISKGRIDMLVARSELPDEQKSRILSDFLGIEEIPLVTRNDSARHGLEAEQYRRWRDIVGPTQDYIQRQRSTRYATHFYNPSSM